MGFDFEPSTDLVFKKYVPVAECKRKKVLDIFSDRNSLFTAEQVAKKLNIEGRTTARYIREILNYWHQRGFLDKIRLPVAKTGKRKFHYFPKRIEIKQGEDDLPSKYVLQSSLSQGSAAKLLIQKSYS
jgi:hypothetical protein